MAGRETFCEFNPEIETFDCYIERLNMYFEANDIANAKQKCVLLSVIGAKYYSLLKNLCSPDLPSTKSFDELVKTLKDHITPKPIIIAERYRFHQRAQQSSETVNEFAADLQKLASTCEFGNFLGEALRDRLVCGLHDTNTQKKLLTKDELDFKKALEIANAMQNASAQAAELKGPTTNTESSKEEVNALEQEEEAFSIHKRKENDKRKNSKCYRCGQNHWQKPCPYINFKCHKCKKTGHLEAVCKSKPVYIIQSAKSTSGEKPYIINLKVKDKNINFEVDTGASVTLINKETYEGNWNKQQAPLKPCNTILRTYTGDDIKVLGKIEMLTEHKKNKEIVPIIVVEGSGPNLLGRDLIRKLNMEKDILKVPCPVNLLTSANKSIIVNKHANLFNNEMGLVKNHPATLLYDDKAEPKFYKARPVPYAMKNKVDAELERLEKEGIIEPVKTSNWAAPIVPILKPDKSVRICGDYKLTVNTVAKPDIYPLPKVEELFNKVSGGKKFSKLDLKNAYQQLPLDEQSKNLTTINTQKGLYRYNRLPYGVSAAAAIFQRTMDNLLKDIDEVSVFQDDILVSGKSDESHLEHLEEVMSRLNKEGFKLKEEKCEFFLDEVTYLGHRITAHGILPTQEKVRAIDEAPRPKDTSELKSFLGLVNFYGKFLPNLSTILSPLNTLLQKGVVFRWGQKQTDAFIKVKELLKSAHVLVHYDQDLPITLSCDASSVGLGAVLSHQTKDGEKPIAYASRSLNKAEKNYSNIEREALAIVFGVKKFHEYLFGRSFLLHTDHKPLMTLFNENKQIPQQASARIQRWALILSAYTYEINYKEGSSMSHADAFSRLPSQETETESDQPEEIIFLMDHLEATAITAQEIKLKTQADPTLATVKQYILSGWPKDSQLSEEKREILQKYKRHEQELSVENGCVLLCNRVVIPEKLQKDMLKELHSNHPGIVKMKALARSYVWWPEMDNDIELTVKRCESCQQVRHMPEKVPLHPWEWPEKAWSRLHIDFAGPFLGHMFMVLVDAHSKWQEIKIMKSITSSKTIENLREIFATHGIPDTIVSDNGATFTSSEFKKFTDGNGIKHIRTAPYQPSTNGLAENAVKSFKEALKKMSEEMSLQHRVSIYMITQHVTPHTTTGVPPCELLIKRRLKTNLDRIRPSLSDHVRANQEKQKQNYNGTPRVLEVGDTVYAKNYGAGPRWFSGIITAEAGPRSFQIRLLDGRIIRRHINQMRRRETIKKDRTQTFENNNPIYPSKVEEKHHELDVIPTSSRQNCKDTDNNHKPTVENAGHNVIDPQIISASPAQEMKQKSQNPVPDVTKPASEPPPPSPSPPTPRPRRSIKPPDRLNLYITHICDI